MNPLQYILDFLKQLVRYRVSSVEFKGKAAIRNAEYRAKSAVAKKFNAAVDGAAGKAKDAIKKKPQDQKPQDQKPT